MRVLCTPHPHQTLDGVVAAFNDEAVVAVLDPAWPAPLRERAVADLHDAARSNRLGPGRLVVFSSGSTSQPRGVIRTHASWRATAAALTELTRLHEGDPVGLAGPPSASFAFPSREMTTKIARLSHSQT